MDEVVGSPADALVTARSNVALCVVTADCAPIAIVGGPVGAAIHAGWQGLRAGIIEAAVERMRGLAPAGTALKAYLGPCIHPTNYAFSPIDLETVVDRYGPTVRSTTAKGEPALDMVAAVASACAGLGLELDVSLCRDTADPPYFSHRIRRDTGRQAMFVWRDEPVFQS